MILTSSQFDRVYEDLETFAEVPRDMAQTVASWIQSPAVPAITEFASTSHVSNAFRLAREVEADLRAIGREQPDNQERAWLERVIGDCLLQYARDLQLEAVLA